MIELTSEQIAIFKEMKVTDPVKFCQLMLITVGKDLIFANVTDASFSCEADMPDGKRYKIEVNYKLNPV